MLFRANQKGQAVAEMALFGSLVLIIFSTLLSSLQRDNDQQYVRMEAFRRALEKGCTYFGLDSESGGASVQLVLLENRRHSDISSGYRKGSPQTLSASASVFWAVPKLGSNAENVLVYRINEDQTEFPYDSGAAPNTGNLTTETQTTFNEAIAKNETPGGITNTAVSTIQETVTTTIPYEGGGPFLELTQGLYRDTDGQYKYSAQAVGTEVVRGKQWQTPF